MKYKTTFLLAIFLLLSINISAQMVDVSSTICKTVENRTASFHDGYKDTIYRSYIPYTHEEKIPIHVTLVFLQQNDGTGGFQSNNQEHQRIWDDVELKINQMYENLKNSDLPNCYNWKDPFLTDTKIYFKFHRLYIKDGYAWNRCNNKHIVGGIQQPPLYYIEYIQNRIDADRSIPLGITVFFTEDSIVYKEYQSYGNCFPTTASSTASYAVSAFPEEQYSQIHMPDIYCKYLRMKFGVTHQENVDWETTVWGWFVNSLANTMAHELGHSLDLRHYCDHYETNDCPHALMHQANIDPQHLHNYIPPTEIGKMHLALMNTRLRNFVDMNLPIVGTMNITANLSWNAPFRCYADLDIAKSGSVDMYGAVQMPKKAKIEVSGQLYARSADIQCANPSENWQGIRVKSGGLLYLENATISSHDIIMEPGSTLILSGSIEFKNGHKAVLGSGVYVCVASSFTDKSVSKSFYVNGVPSMVLKNGKASGVTSKYAVTCSSIGWQRFQTRCTAIEDILYVQNKTLTQDETFVGKTILIGNSVDENRVKGDVIIKSPARATFIYTDRILFDKGFRCESGGNYRALQCK